MPRLLPLFQRKLGRWISNNFALSVLQAAFTKLSLKFSLTCLKQCWKKSFLGLKMLLSRGVRF